MKELKAQDYKAKLLAEIAPSGFDAHAFALDLHLIKAPSPGQPAARIMMTDGGWIEIDRCARSVRTWGPSGKSKILAQALAGAVGCEVYHLGKTATVGANADALKVSRVSEDGVQSLVKWWAMRGFDATAAPDGCWINAGAARILDTGNRLEVHGGLTDRAVEALLTKAKNVWDSSVELDGHWTQAEQDHIWIAAMRQGIEVGNCHPSREIRAAWQREQEATAKSVVTVSAVRTEIIEAQRLLEAAKGDVEAARQLPGNLQAFVAVFLDDDQRRELAAQPIAEVVPNLNRFRNIGQTELDSYSAPSGQKIAFAEPIKSDETRVQAQELK